MHSGHMVQLNSKVTFACIQSALFIHLRCILHIRSGCVWNLEKRVWQLIKSLLQLYCEILHLLRCISCMFRVHLTHSGLVLHMLWTRVNIYLIAELHRTWWSCDNLTLCITPLMYQNKADIITDNWHNQNTSQMHLNIKQSF